MNEGLKVFLTVAEQGSFTKAAALLHLTQPAVSQHIRSLESDLGAHLIDRNNRMIRLTRAGEIVEEHARQIVQTEDHMRRVVAGLSNDIAGPLHIGASYSIGEYMLPAVLALFCRDNPQVEPTIEIGNTHDIASLVARGQLDVGLVEGTYSPAEVATQTLGEDQMILVANPDHPFLKDEHVTSSQLSTECWILREEGSGTREMSDRILQEQSILPQRTMTFSSTQAIKEAVRAGLGISVLSTSTVQMELELGMLREIQFEGLPITRTLFVVVRSSSFHPRVLTTFVEFTQEHFRQSGHNRLNRR